jgi:hypothetical protein
MFFFSLMQRLACTLIPATSACSAATNEGHLDVMEETKVRSSAPSLAPQQHTHTRTEKKTHDLQQHAEKRISFIHHLPPRFYHSTKKKKQETHPQPSQLCSRFSTVYSTRGTCTAGAAASSAAAAALAPATASSRSRFPAVEAVAAGKAETSPCAGASANITT